ncbi:hypothetical protein AB4P17_09775 [Escherichia coli]|uniref:hypothetical protein n=1 Tax=Escherichia coli TaxID=562 RepID=UPI0034C6D723
MRKARAHPNYGGLCGGAERLAGRWTGNANSAQFTTQLISVSGGDSNQSNARRQHDHSNHHF